MHRASLHDMILPCREIQRRLEHGSQQPSFRNASTGDAILNKAQPSHSPLREPLPHFPGKALHSTPNPHTDACTHKSATPKATSCLETPPLVPSPQQMGALINKTALAGSSPLPSTKYLRETSQRPPPPPAKMPESPLCWHHRNPQCTPRYLLGHPDPRAHATHPAPQPPPPHTTFSGTHRARRRWRRLQCLLAGPEQLCAPNGLASPPPPGPSLLNTPGTDHPPRGRLPGTSPATQHCPPSLPRRPGLPAPPPPAGASAPPFGQKWTDPLSPNHPHKKEGGTPGRAERS